MIDSFVDRFFYAKKIFIYVITQNKWIMSWDFISQAIAQAPTYHLAETAIGEVGREPHSRGDA